MKHWASLLVVAITVWLAGCAGMIPPRAPLPADAVVNRHGAQEGFIGAGDAHVVQEPVPSDWWRLYDSPTLNELVERALAANTDLRVAAANIQKSEAALDIANAAKTPTTGLTTSTSFGRRSAQEELHPGKPLPSKFVYGAGFSVAYQVDLFGQIQRAVDAAESDLGAVVAARDAVRVTVVAETTRAYLELCSAGREIGVARDQVALQSKSTELTRRLVAYGRAISIDVDRAGAQEEQLRATIPPLAAQRRIAIYRLAALTGQTPQDLPRNLEACVQEPHLKRPLPVGDGAGLLQRRPDIRRAEFEVLSTDDRIGVAKGDLYPKIVLGASVGSVGGVQHAFREDSLKFSVGPLISWEFPDRARVQARIRGAGADHDAALARFDGVVLSALKETESALEIYARDHERRTILESARDRAASAARDTQRLYEAGRVGYLPVLDAWRTLNQIEQSLAAADSRLAADQVGVFVALGGGWMTN